MVKYIKGKVDLLKTTFVNTCWVIKLFNFLTVNDIKYLVYLVSSLRLSMKVWKLLKLLLFLISLYLVIH